MLSASPRDQLIRVQIYIIFWQFGREEMVNNRQSVSLAMAEKVMHATQHVFSLVNHNNLKGERERERKRETDRQTDRQTETERAH